MLKPTEPDALEERPLIWLIGILTMLMMVMCGALAAVFVLPRWAPMLAQSLLGADAKGYWDLSRASGIVAYLLSWLSVVLGLLITNKFARVFPGGPTATDLHEFSSLLSMAFALFHIIILLGDHYISYTVIQLAIPFASFDYQPFWVGLGQLGFYLSIPLTFSFYVRRWIGFPAWRWLHFGTFISFAFITVHGMIAGSDTRAPFMLALYAITGLSVVFLTSYRVLTLKGVSAW
ncbi:MAG: hypothetical protein HY868_05940 [Chloroflexi bacterium]|nr:hypothetical protein [Chloroflexota bacterium]